MTLLRSDAPVGKPAFALSDDQVATVVDLIGRGAAEARNYVTPGMHEVPITILVRKAMRRAKVALGPSNLQIRGEHELEDMATSDPIILGRIDITLQFLHQFGDEDAYVAVECKRVSAGNSSLNSKYVSDGVTRFVAGKYAAGHAWGFMLGYVLALPVDDIVTWLEHRIVKKYGTAATLVQDTVHPLSLAALDGLLPQPGGQSYGRKWCTDELSRAACLC